MTRTFYGGLIRPLKLRALADNFDDKISKWKNRKRQQLNGTCDGSLDSLAVSFFISKWIKNMGYESYHTTRDIVEWENFLLVGTWAKFQKSFKRHFSIVRNFFPDVIFVEFSFEFIFGDEKHFRWFVGFIPTYVNNWKMRGRISISYLLTKKFRFHFLSDLLE